jgi:DNA-binding NarL/FixJ family response regulator
MGDGAIRLVVKSRRRLVREAICAYLAARPDFAVVGHTGDIDALAGLCLLRRPDAVLVDSVKVTPHTVAALARIRAAAPGTAVVVTYAEGASAVLEAAIRAGITALVPCSRGLEAVLRAVYAHARSDGLRQPDGVALTDHDLRVVSLLSTGYSVSEMAELLDVSPRTVENQKRRLYGKLGVGSSSEAVSRAASLGLVDPPRSTGRASGPEPGRSPLVVVHGPPGHSRCRVHLALVAAGLPFVSTSTLAALSHEHWARWHRGPLVTVLVDPTAGDWPAQPPLGACIVVVLTVEPDPSTLAGLLLRGVCALVRGDDVAADLAPVLSVVVRGYLALDLARLPDLTGWMTRSDGVARVPALTSRDSDVLGAIASGRTIRQTARLLGITAKSVENAQTRLYRKLGARNRAEALAIAHWWGLFDPDTIEPHRGNPSLAPAAHTC